MLRRLSSLPYAIDPWAEDLDKAPPQLDSVALQESAEPSGDINTLHPSWEISREGLFEDGRRVTYVIGGRFDLLRAHSPWISARSAQLPEHAPKGPGGRIEAQDVGDDCMRVRLHAAAPSSCTRRYDYDAHPDSWRPRDVTIAVHAGIPYHTYHLLVAMAVRPSSQRHVSNAAAQAPMIWKWQGPRTQAAVHELQAMVS